MREINLENCEIIGRGAIGTVYRVDDELVVKVYDMPDSLPMIENEQKRARQAFVKGIPTAIPFSVVKVGDRYGSMFELLRSVTLHDLLLSRPDRKDELLRRYAQFIRQLHAVEMEPGELPDARDVFLGYMEKIRSILPDSLYERICGLIRAMPENLHVIHGDLQMKNIMFSGDEPMFIDLDTLSVGDPVFEMTSIYIDYVMFALEEPGNMDRFMGMPDAEAASVWEKTTAYCFEDRSPAELEEIRTKVILLAQIRFLFLIYGLGVGKPELKQIRTDHALARLQDLTERVSSLVIGNM